MNDYPCIFNDAGTVTRYDKLRHIAPHVLDAICSLVCGYIVKSQSNGKPRILDAGSGTGRFAIPIAMELSRREIAAEVCATDQCRPMLNTLADRWPITNLKVQLRCVEADIQQPLPSACAPSHVVFTISTFHILKQWQAGLDNLLIVLARNGFFIFIRENNQFMHQTEGFEKNSDFPYLNNTLSAFMRFYHAQRASVGEPYQPRTLRYSDMLPAIQYLRTRELVEEDPRVPESALSWQKPHTFTDILHCFRHRQMTTWGSDLSDHSRERIADSLEQWIASNGINPQAEFMLPSRLIPHVFRKN